MAPCLPLRRAASRGSGVGASAERVGAVHGAFVPHAATNPGAPTSAPLGHDLRHRGARASAEPTDSSGSSSPPSPFAHLRDVWEIDTLQVEGSEGGESEPRDGVKNKNKTQDPLRVVVAAESARTRLFATGTALRGDPFSQKTQVVASKALASRKKNTLVCDPVGEGKCDSSDDESEDETTDDETQKNPSKLQKRVDASARKAQLNDHASIDHRDRASMHQHVLGLTLNENSGAFDRDDPVDETAMVRRMELSLKATLLWCASAFREDEAFAEKKRNALACGKQSPKNPPSPPLGTHLIRRCALDSTPRTLDLYVQDQCSYIYDHAVRTVDHFIDGKRQQTRASMKIALAPTALADGGAVMVTLCAPGPFVWDKVDTTKSDGGDGGETKEPEKENEEGVSDPDSFENNADARSVQTSESSDSEFVVVSPPASKKPSQAAPPFADGVASDSESACDSDASESHSSSTESDDSRGHHDQLPPWTRQGSYIELGGSSGHPDYLKRVQKPEREPEVYKITMPSLRFEGFVKGRPVARFTGRLQLECPQTGLVSVLHFKPYDAQFAVATGVRSNVVAGSIFSKENGTVHKVLCGTTEGDVESLGVEPGCAGGGESGVTTSTTEAPHVSLIIRGMSPYHNATRGGFDARSPLFAPGAATLKRFWHAVVDAMHAKDLREPLNSVKYELLQPLRTCAAKLVLGDDAKYIGAVGKKKKEKSEKVDPESEKNPDEVGRRMRYEFALLLATALPNDAPPPLPRFWDPQPTRRMRR